MRGLAILLAGALAIITVGFAVSAKQPDPARTLKSAASFASIADEKQRSIALFQEPARCSPTRAA